MFLKPDSWKFGENIRKETDPYTDSSWPGCQYIIPVHNSLYCLAINLKETGKSKWVNGGEWKRVRIEFVGDGKPSHFVMGYLFDNGVPV